MLRKRKRSAFRALAVVTFFLLALHGTAQADAIITGAFGVRSVSQDQIFRAAKVSGFDIVITNDVAKAKDNGIKCLYQFSLTREIAADANQWSAFKDTVKKAVSKYRNDSTVYGYYVADEPDWNQVPASKYMELNTLIKSIDNSKPTIAVLTLPNKWDSYLPWFDIIAIDPYLPNTHTGHEIDKARNWINKLLSDFKKYKINKRFWVVLGVFEEIPKNGTPAAFRKPTPNEYNSMVEMSLANNASGILVFCLEKNETASHYGWNLLRDDPLLWDAVRKTHDLVRAKEPKRAGKRI